MNVRVKCGRSEFSGQKKLTLCFFFVSYAFDLTRWAYLYRMLFFLYKENVKFAFIMGSLSDEFQF